MLLIGNEHVAASCFGSRLDEMLRRDLRPGTPAVRVHSESYCGVNAANFVATTARTNTACSRIEGPEIAANDVCGNANIGMQQRCPRFSGQLAPMRNNIDSLLSSRRPKTTVIALGIPPFPRDFEPNRQAAIALIGKVRAAGSACVWVGPPKPDPRLVEASRNFEANLHRLRESVIGAGCTWVESAEGANGADPLTDPQNYDGYSSRGTFGCGTATTWANGAFARMRTVVQQSLSGGTAPRQSGRVD